jgi:hypothetical protein
MNSTWLIRRGKSNEHDLSSRGCIVGSLKFAKPRSADQNDHMITAACFWWKVMPWMQNGRPNNICLNSGVFRVHGKVDLEKDRCAAFSVKIVPFSSCTVEPAPSAADHSQLRLNAKTRDSPAEMTGNPLVSMSSDFRTIRRTIRATERSCTVESAEPDRGARHPWNVRFRPIWWLVRQHCDRCSHEIPSEESPDWSFLYRNTEFRSIDSPRFSMNFES